MTAGGAHLTAAQLHALRGRLHVVLGFSELLQDGDPYDARDLGARLHAAVRSALDTLEQAERRQ